MQFSILVLVFLEGICAHILSHHTHAHTHAHTLQTNKQKTKILLLVKYLEIVSKIHARGSNWSYSK